MDQARLLSAAFKATARAKPLPSSMPMTIPPHWSIFNILSTQFGLPDPPSFTKINETGGTTLPGTDPTGPFSVTGHLSWEVEESLDIEWAHVIAPQAQIVLVECNSPSDFDLILSGVTTAESLSGVSAISISFSGPEFAGENRIDTIFNTPAGHNGISFFAATGDNGSPGGFPAYSQNVLAVGGTSLQVSGNSYAGETGWSGSGGGISNGDETQPSYQSPFFSSSQRTIPDISMDANPGTGVPVYDSYDLPTNSWIKIGGTSLATPMWAGLIAIVNQGRVINGLTPLDGPSQTLPLIYGLPSSDFNDIVTGNNGGFSATIGYDLVTGRGTPIAGLLIPDLLHRCRPPQPSPICSRSRFNRYCHINPLERHALLFFHSQRSTYRACHAFSGQRSFPLTTLA